MTMALAVAMVACEGAAGMPGKPGEPGKAGEPAGLPPQVSDQIADLTLVAGASQTIDLSEHFLDPDAKTGESLTFAAESSDSASVTVAVANDKLTVRATAVGTAKVTVTATDADDLINRDVFNVTVTARPPENQAPTATGVISEVDVEVGKSTTVDVSMYFTDPDEGDTLTYKASVPESEKDVTVSVADGSSIVTINGVAEGSATVTVTATDAGGLSAMQTINVDVNAMQKGAPPQTVGSPMKISLGAQGSETVDLSKYFNHPDGDTLTYTAVSNNAAVTASTTGSSLMVTANNETISAIMAEITVTATDSDGQTAQQRFEVMVAAMAPAVSTELEVYLNSSKKLIVDALDYFSAMEGATYAANPLGGNVEVTEVVGSKTKFDIQPIQKGKDTVLLTQTSKDKLTVNEVELTVEVPNQAPKRTTEVYSSDPFTGSIPTDTSEYNKKSLFKFEIDDLEDYFEDDDDDALTYSSTYSTAYAKVLKVSAEYIIVDVFKAKAGRVISVPVHAEDNGDPDVDGDNAKSARTVRVRLEINDVAAQKVQVKERTDGMLRDTRDVELRDGPGADESELIFGETGADKGSLGVLRKLPAAEIANLEADEDIAAKTVVSSSGSSIKLLRCDGDTAADPPLQAEDKPRLDVEGTETGPLDNQYKLCFEPKAIGTTTITFSYKFDHDGDTATDMKEVTDKFRVVVVRPEAKKLD